MSGQQRRSSTLLEVEAEAADYFNLDLNQVSLFTSRSSNDLIGATLNDQHQHLYPSPRDKMAPTTPTNTSGKRRQSCKKQTPTNGTSKTISKNNENYPNHNKSPKLAQQTDTSKAQRGEQQRKQCKSNLTAGFKSPVAPAGGLVCSSPSSTNSLPSISSSPSVSPSLVCPHLSLDDLLGQTRPSNSSVSPHTIGLCARCRLDPPPNVHSPLSPVFKPTAAPCRDQQTKQSRRRQQQGGHTAPTTTTNLSPANQGDDFMAQCKMTTMRRVHSDHQASDYSKRKSCIRLRPHQARDDSLDYYLEPDELRRLQMSPTLRNSVEFIRKNSIESGRVVRIYKNGQPYDRPLRVCILRGEFATLNHLLDHINGRQLIPLGARYLFHLDGQLVYSVHELKHGSIYIVSGVRTFDYRANSLLKEKHKKEQVAAPSALNRRHLQSINRVVPSRDKWASNKFTMTGQANDNQMAKRQTSTALNPMGSRQTMSGKQAIKTTGPNKVRNSHKQPGESIYSSIGDDMNLSKQDERHPLALEGRTTSRLTRAKSELGDLPNKRKKNVTFMDTGRGSSPTIVDLATPSDTTTNSGHCEQMQSNQMAAKDESRSQPEKPINESIIKELNTNEIGIQVSDSIDGFLIDLPMPMPAKGDDSNLKNGRVGATTSTTRPSSIHSRRLQRRTTNEKDPTRPASNEKQAPAATKKIVTITERQLSVDEMSKFKELSHGDHHHELSQPEIKIHLDHSVVREDDDDDQLNAGDQTPIVMADEPPTMGPTRGDAHQAALGAQVSQAGELADGPDEQRADHWQYPAGRESSATPIERPVSQSGPNETVRARVTTPSPSLSTLGDNISVSMSLDQQQEQPVAGTVAAEGQPDEQHESNRLLARHVSEANQTNRQRVDLMGELCPGQDPPDKNFKLVWVNGFLINDLYPENCANPAQQLGAASPINKPRGGSGQTTPEPGPGGGPTVEAHLSPGYVAPSPTPAANQPIQFKSSERFHNWTCYSQRYDELVYPAGSLIVLWCKWTEAQRYYSKHTSNVSCLVLSTLDTRLAGSAHVSDTSQKPQVSSQIHLWSLETLATLLVIDDDQFKNKRIFSLRLKNATSTGCELSVAARDDKQLYLFAIRRRLKSDAQDSSEPDKPTKKSRYNTDSSVLKTSKVLQNNQLPLIVMSMPLSDQDPLATSASEANKKSASKQSAAGADANNQLLLSFGRRHFNLWLVDRRQSRLRPMQAENKSAKFVEMIIRANCLVKLAPKELLIGDSDGNLALILLDYKPSQQQHQKQAIKFPLGQQSDASSELKYAIKTVTLLDPNESAPKLSPTAITCLTRITGTLFMTADSQCTLKFWQIKREKTNASDLFGTIKLQSEEQFVSCQLIGSIHLPADLGLICTIILAKYDRKMSLVEFYVISTSNTILFGTTKLLLKNTSNNLDSKLKDDSVSSSAMVNNTTLSVVYEGHETAATCLVADVASNRSKLRRKSLQLGLINSGLPDNCFYFTCSLDSRICKWNGHKLVWKSLLPSPCASLAIHPTGFVLAVGSTDGTVYILDKVSGLLVSYFPLTPVRINCLAYSRDGLLLAAGCANGSIFILPVYERGLIYKKVSIFQSPYAVVSLQFSTDNRYMLTSVTHGSYQELLLWDLPNFRYMRDNVKLAADKIQWFDSICSGSEDVRAIWENANLATTSGELEQTLASKRSPKRTLDLKGQTEFMVRPATIVNLSCHRLVLQAPQMNNNDDGGVEQHKQATGYVIASDTSGHLRLFRYPCYDIQQGFYALRISSTPVNCCRFLNSQDEPNFISSSIDGSICLWKLQ